RDAAGSETRGRTWDEEMRAEARGEVRRTLWLEQVRLGERIGGHAVGRDHGGSRWRCPRIAASRIHQQHARRSCYRTVARPPDVQQRIGLIRSTNVDVFKGLAEYPQVATGVDHARAQPRKLQRLDRAVDCEALGDA